MINSENSLINERLIKDNIYIIRGFKVMLDEHLADLYQVETRRLNEQVKRNIDRFPSDFCFQLTNEEYNNLMSQFATSSWGGRRKPPFVFTELSIAMLSSVLNSQKAIQVNISIMRIFNRLRQMFDDNQELRMAIKFIEQNVKENSLNIKVLFDQIEELLKNKVDQNENIELIGFKKK